MHRNERYFDKNEGKHNFFAQLDEEDQNEILEPAKTEADAKHKGQTQKTVSDSGP